ncbi:unnamed protein product [Lymnaea stagnalis]|uniref:Coiled-coil alpha-helical rod protein 1 n=1 Tax=Lymnaea stagnalis TaxID=6523 RepID=A0AAV2I001_LYMST
MAANLNKPADFLATPKVSRDVVLIPPSEFEKPKIFQVKELEKIKQQIEDLRQENERLRSVQSQSQSQIQVPSFSLPHNEYADELIKRQGGEIAELKSELIKCRQAYKQEVGEWNRKVEFMEEEHRHELKRLEKEWERKEDEFEQRYARISSELQRTLEDTETETSVLNDKLEKTRTALSNRVKELEDTLNVVQRESERTLNQQDVELRNKSRIIEDQAHQISKLKTYIGEAEQTHKPAHVWRVEKETVENKLKIARAENEKLQSELELMDVRFKALSDILAVQEAELSKPNTEGLGLSKQQNLLITRWREKVFSLLVQQKSSEIVHKNDVNNLNQKIRDLTDKLAASDANVEVFKLSLVDKSAQLQMERNSKERLQQELDHLNKVAICLDDQSRDSLDSVKGLTEFIERFLFLMIILDIIVSMFFIFIFKVSNTSH